MTESHFDNIDKIIGEHLLNAKQSIDIALAWFTNAGLGKILCQKSILDNLNIRIILSDDKLNFDFAPFHKKLIDSGIELFISEKSKANALMHNKFCIIDSNIIITGSFNWTKTATKNHENIIIVKDDKEITSKYNYEFNKILSNSILYFPKKETKITATFNRKSKLSDDLIWDILQIFHESKFNPTPQRVWRMLKGTNSRSIKLNTKESKYYNRIMDLNLNPKEVLFELKKYFVRNKEKIHKEFNYEERGWRNINFPGDFIYNLYEPEKLEIIKSYNTFTKPGTIWSETERSLLSNALLYTNDLKLLTKLIGRGEHSIIRMAKRVLYENPELRNKFIEESRP